MKRLLIAVGIVLIASVAYAQDYRFRKGESITNFMNRQLHESNENSPFRGRLGLHTTETTKVEYEGNGVRREYNIKRRGNKIIIEED